MDKWRLLNKLGDLGRSFLGYPSRWKAARNIGWEPASDVG